MKIRNFVFVSLILISNNLFSQKDVLSVTRKNSLSEFKAVNLNTSEYLFGYPKPNTSDVNIGFFWNSGKRINFELCNIQQLNEFEYFDSLFIDVKKNIKVFVDSFKNDAYTHRIDYVINYGSSSQFRVVDNILTSNSYTNLNGELMQLKVDMDTLRIKINMTNYSKKIYSAVEDKPIEYIEPIVIQFILKNIADIETISEKIISECLTRAKEDVGKYLNDNYRDKRLGNFNFTYNMNTNPITLLSPTKPNQIRRTYIDENFVGLFGVSYSLQFLKGQPISSFILGGVFPLKNPLHKIGYKSINYFVFERSISGNTKLNNYNFFELSYRKDKAKNVDNNNFIGINEYSFGVLLKRSSDFFQKNTFYFGLPYAKFGRYLNLRPELYFSDDYVEPSIKLTLFGF